MESGTELEQLVCELDEAIRRLKAEYEPPVAAVTFIGTARRAHSAWSGLAYGRFARMYWHELSAPPADQDIIHHFRMTSEFPEGWIEINATQMRDYVESESGYRLDDFIDLAKEALGIARPVYDKVLEQLGPIADHHGLARIGERLEKIRAKPFGRRPESVLAELIPKTGLVPSQVAHMPVTTPPAAELLAKALSLQSIIAACLEVLSELRSVAVETRTAVALATTPAAVTGRADTAEPSPWTVPTLDPGPVSLGVVRTLILAVMAYAVWRFVPSTAEGAENLLANAGFVFLAFAAVYSLMLVVAAINKWKSSGQMKWAWAGILLACIGIVLSGGAVAMHLDLALASVFVPVCSALCALVPFLFLPPGLANSVASGAFGIVLSGLLSGAIAYWVPS